MLAEQAGFKAAAFCPLQEWKSKKLEVEPGKTKP